MENTKINCKVKIFSEPQPYVPIWEAMRDFIRTKPKHNEIWLLEHQPVYTQGQAGLEEHILQNNNIPIVRSDRGGQVTYHGPGQLMVYTMINLRQVGLGIRSMVSLLEQCVIALLKQYGIAARSRPDAPGVYVNCDTAQLSNDKGVFNGEKKIASLGLRVRHGYCYHGLALNLAMDLSPFQAINPCGYSKLQITQFQDLVDNWTLSDIQRFIIDYLQQQLSFDISSIDTL